MFPCLILTPSWQAHQIVQWEKSISMLYTGEIHVLENYDEEARSPSITIRFPAVGLLTKKLVGTKKEVKYSRANCYQRDGYQCQYCGDKHSHKKLNLDHVIPRSKGGTTTFENIVTSCIQCNLKKGSKTLKQSGMKLRKIPVHPKSLPMTSNHLSLPAMVPTLWLPYLNDRIAKIRVE